MKTTSKIGVINEGVKNAILSFFILSLFIIVACEIKETPVKPYDRGGLTISTIEMGSNYDYQHYYDLSSGKIVKSNLKTDWDFSYTCDGSQVVELNTSRNILASKTNSYDFDDDFDTSGIKLAMDYPDGNKDSLAIGRIKDQSPVFIVSLGFDMVGNQLGIVKIQFTQQPDGNLSFIFGPLKGSQRNVGVLTTNNTHNRVFYSVLKKTPVAIEPPKTDYDLLITQYLYFFLEPQITPYLVAGVLLNPYNTRASRIDGPLFTGILAADTLKYVPGTKRDIIGFDWKTFNLTQNQYLVVPNRSYIIQDADGFYYKLRFVDFYNEKGFKGYPKFEFIKL
jgi:hypothetical protein